VHVRQVDAGDRKAMQLLLREISSIRPPLRGIVHAAGVVDDGVLLQQDESRWRAVLHGKAHGARLLHELTLHQPLDFFVMYSAAGLLLGPAGQAAYAAANAELDALAAARHAAGLPATSVAWGMWRDGGMAAQMAARGADTWSARGLGWIAPAQGFQRLQHLLAMGVPHAAVMPVDWARFLDAERAIADRQWFGALGVSGRAAAATRAAAPAAEVVVPAWRAAPQGQRRALVISHLRGKALLVLGLDSSVALDEKTPLKEAGLDSLMAVELRNALTRSTGRSLPVTLLFDYPTLEKLADYLLRVLELEAPPGPAAKSAPSGLAAMSEEEAEALLLAELQGGSARSNDDPR
jgi:acyl carrier protein